LHSSYHSARQKSARAALAYHAREGKEKDNG
jgi:hypothetical protein